MDSNKEWRPVPGFVGYETNRYGLLRSYRANRAGVLNETAKERRPNNYGYFRLFDEDGQGVNLPAAVIAARAFVDGFDLDAHHPVIGETGVQVVQRDPAGGGWKEIPGYERRYWANLDGRIWTTGRGAGSYYTAARELSVAVNGETGYGIVGLGCAPGKRQSRVASVHRLVALTFIGPCESGLVVDHVDGDKKNNRADNLRYVTYAENTRKSWVHRSCRATYSSIFAALLKDGRYSEHELRSLFHGRL